jgi:hypothetical protein
MPRIAQSVWECNQEKCLFKLFLKSDKNGTYFDIDINNLLYVCAGRTYCLEWHFTDKGETQKP